MKYEAVYLYNNQQQFVGVAIKKTDAPQLQSINIWSQTEEEIEDFKKTLSGLNDEEVLRQFWPDAYDPEVVELVEDPDWEPLELHEEQVPDWDKSTLVMVREPVFGYEYNGEADAAVPIADENGEVHWRDTDEIDPKASVIIYKKALVPDPTEAQNRYYKAQEIVARRRLGVSPLAK